jgi:uncharacterized protein YijF (DUF1287 family)
MPLKIPMNFPVLEANENACSVVSMSDDANAWPMRAPRVPIGIPLRPSGLRGDRQAVILLRQGYEGQVDTPLQSFQRPDFAPSLFAHRLCKLLLLACFTLLLPACKERTKTPPPPPPNTFGGRIVAASLSQIGVTTHYDPAYTALDYPNGDVPRERGVCTDVVIRALRDAHGVDLQKLVHEDMRADFSAYPKLWGLNGPDRNIDHRRVPNLRVFLQRRGCEIPLDPDAPLDHTTFQPGDIVTSTVTGNRPHVMIVSHLKCPRSGRALVIHNSSARGTHQNDALAKFPLTGHYRWK